MVFLEIVYQFAYTNCMSRQTIEKVHVNLTKFKEARGEQSLAEFAETTGFNADMLSKIERGKRWTTLQKFAEFCQRTNLEPNNFFEIIVKKS